MPATETITPQTAAEWIRTGKAVLIDVREPDEFRAEHIALAVSMPLSSVSGLLDGLPDDRPVIFQCQKGGRGAAACDIASTGRGNRPVYNLAGGIEAWKGAGLPVAGGGSAASTGIPIFRQVQIVVGTLVLLATLAGFAGYPAGFAVAGLAGTMLAIAGLSGWCGLAMLLQRMPWNAPRRPSPRAA